jgi:hypothetical protein
MGVEMTASAKSDTPRTVADIVVELAWLGDGFKDEWSGHKLIREAQDKLHELETALTAARAEAEAWKAYANHQEMCHECAEDVRNCDAAKELREAIDAARSTEGKK